MELFEELPDNDAGCDGDVHGVLGAVLGDFYATVAHIYYLLLHSLHLITQNYGNFGQLTINN